jgi:hypothetical protein
MTEQQAAAQAVALAGMVPQMLRRRLAGLLSDTGRTQTERSLAEAQKAFRTVQRKYRRLSRSSEAA